MVKPNKFNTKKPVPAVAPPPPYIVALFEAVDPKCFADFQSRLIEMIKNDGDASFTRALLALHDCQFYKRHRSKADIQDYGQALVERFGYSNQAFGPAPARPYGDPLLEALYHASLSFRYHMLWAKNEPDYQPADYVDPPRHPLKTRR